MGLPIGAAGRRVPGSQAASGSSRSRCGSITTSELNEAEANLPEQFRKRIGLAPTGDWLATHFPSRSELTEIQSQARELAATQIALQRLDGIKAQLDQKRIQIASLGRTIEEMKSALGSSEATIREQREGPSRGNIARSTNFGSTEGVGANRSGGRPPRQISR